MSIYSQHFLELKRYKPGTIKKYPLTTLTALFLLINNFKEKSITIVKAL